MKKYSLVAIAAVAFMGQGAMAGYRVVGEGTPEAPYTVPVAAPVAPATTAPVSSPVALPFAGDERVMTARIRALEAENKDLREQLRDAEFKLGKRRAPSTDASDVTSIRFQTGSVAAPQPAAKKMELLERARGAKSIEIVGYTDNTGSAEINQRIALARAQLVKDVLVRGGIDADLIKVREQSGIYYATNATAEGRAANRRAIVTFN